VKKPATFLMVVLMTLMSATTLPLYSQVIEVDAAFGFGGTTDIESWTKITENGATFRLTDWSFFSGYTSVNGFFPVTKTISLGGSIGYQHLFWYEYDYYDIDGIKRNTYHEDVNATRFIALARFNLQGDNFFDLGVGAFVVKDGSDNYSAPTVLGNFGHFFKLTDAISIPLKFSAGVIFESNPIFPITIGTGVSYKLK
jgi:hypothetical protein